MHMASTNSLPQPLFEIDELCNDLGQPTISSASPQREQSRRLEER
jgi:hypothetical protein